MQGLTHIVDWVDCRVTGGGRSDVVTETAPRSHSRMNII